MHGLFQDIRTAARALRRQPVLTLAAAICLALGIGANTTVFSALRAYVLYPIPAADAEGLVMVAEQSEGTDRWFDRMSPATFDDLRRASTTIRDLAAYHWWDVNITGGDQPEQVVAFAAEPRLFALLGARPLLGRVIGDDRSATPEALLSEPLWRRRFGGDPAVVGRKVEINGDPYVVSGVMDARFVFPAGAELWVPMRLSPAEAVEREGRWLNVIGRLAPGASLDDARAEARTIAARVAAEHPGTNAGWSMRVNDANAEVSSNARPYMLAMQFSVGLVLLIACVNVANLLLARATGREREIGVRIALGAGRWRIVRLLMVEALMLAVVGGGIGLLVALWGVLALRTSLPPELVKFNPGWLQIRVNGAALAFTALATCATGLIFGLAPALQALRATPGGSLRDGRGAAAGAHRHRARTVLAVLELATAVVLLVTTGLTVRTFVQLQRAALGFDAAPLLTMNLSLPEREYEPAEIAPFHERLRPALRSLAGVEEAGSINALPMSWDDRTDEVALEGEVPRRESDLQRRIRVRVADLGYFDALGIPPTRGRGFVEHDRAETRPVVVISASAAERLFPRDEALGRRIRIGDDTLLREVVGVVRDVRHNPNLGLPQLHPVVYLPLAQRPSRSVSLVVRARPGVDPASLAADVQREIGRIDRGVAAGGIATMPRVAFTALAPQRAMAGTFAILGVVAIVLAVVGVYGVIAYATAQRTHELGVRAALGATRGDIERLVLRRGAWMTGIGLALGTGAAIAAARAMSGIMYGVASTDPLTFAGTLALLGGVSLLAAWLPARRAARVAPSVALRAE